MGKYNIAVVGATGMVGRKILEVLGERSSFINELYLFSSKRSAGSKIPFLGKDYTVEELNEENIKSKKIDIALFSAGGSISTDFAPVFAANNAVVIDNSSAWRMDPEVPLVVPEANASAIKLYKNKGIIANPNCSTIQAVVVLKPIHEKYGLRRVVYSTYQAVSGAGVAGYDDLENGIKGEAPKKFKKPIFSNVLPHIDVFLDNGYTKEEMKMIEETQKILGDDSIRVTATTVRVPVYNGHSESINLELNKEFDLDELRALLENSPGIIVMDDPSQELYPTALDCDDTNEVYVGRIRRDFSQDNSLNMWVVADNIRKGAATNTVQIAETLISKWDSGEIQR